MSNLQMRGQSATRWSRFAVAGLFAAVLAGCGGSDGAPGAPGAPGTPGAAGADGVDKTTNSISSASLTYSDLKDRALAVAIQSVDTSADQPVVNFKVTMKDSGVGVRGLRTFTLQLAQLKPAKDGSPSYWQNYIAAGLPLTAVPAFTERGATTQTAPKNPSADAVTVYNADGTVKAQGYQVLNDYGDGNYSVKFGANIKANTNVPYDASLVHRVGVGVRSVVVPGVVGKTAGAYAGPIDPTTGSAFGSFTNTNGAVDVYDFIPATGAMLTDGAGKKTYARDNVTVAACNQCHYKIEYGFPKGNNTSGHFGSRPDTKFCVMCHTPQNADGNVGQGDFTPFIHKIHMGEELPTAETALGISFAEVKYPQDIKQCSTCHKGTVVDSWKNPSLKACGSCHNNVNFTTGVGHVGGAKTDDKLCALCHGATDIALYHVPVTSVTSATSGVTSRYANNSNLPADAYKIDYVIRSVTVDTTTRNVSVAFQVKKNGTAVNFGTYNATTNPNIIPNTYGGPSIRIAYNVSQDGITSPADFNASMSAPSIGVSAPSYNGTAITPGSTTSNIWVLGTYTANGITWTLTSPATTDTTNTYVLTSSMPLPASTTMVTAIMYGSMTQTNLTGKYAFAATATTDFKSYTNSSGGTSYAIAKPGLILNPSIAKGSVTSTGFTARRTVVDNAKCSSCHDQLGLTPNFHGGARNDGTACTICHTPNGNNNGWSYAASTFVHAIHGAAQRSNKYTFQAASATDGYFTIGYPGLLKNCEQCHAAGTYDFSATASAAAVDKLLYSTVVTGAPTTSVTKSPYVTAGYKYGVGYSFLAAGNATTDYYVNDNNGGTSTTTLGNWISLADGSVATSFTAAQNTAGAVRAAEGTTLVNSPISAACFSCHDSSAAKLHMEGNGGSLYAQRTAALTKKETCLVCHGAASSTNGVANSNTPTIKSVHRWW